MEDHQESGKKPVFKQFEEECEARETASGKKYVMVESLEGYDSEDEDSYHPAAACAEESIGSD